MLEKLDDERVIFYVYKFAHDKWVDAHFSIALSMEEIQRRVVDMGMSDGKPYEAKAVGKIVLSEFEAFRFAARIAGSKKSASKAASSRANGMKGGRPPKKPNAEIKVKAEPKKKRLKQIDMFEEGAQE